MIEARAVTRPYVLRLRDGVAHLSSRRRALVAFVAGAASVLAFAPVYFSPILFATLPVFVWLIDTSPTPRNAAIAGWFFGFGYFFFNLFWIGEAFLVEADKFAWLLPFAVTLLPAALALFWALAAGVSRMFWSTGLARVLIFAVTLSVAEWLRGHVLTGLPWNVIGYALTAPVELMQSAGLFGIYGLTLLACIIFTAPLVLLADHDAPASLLVWMRSIAVGLAPLAALWAYGSIVLQTPQTSVPGVRLRIVQPSVLQTEKWRPEFQRRIFDDHLALSVMNAAGRRDDLAGITHLFWPEAAMPFLPLEAPKALEAIAEMLPPGRVLVTGALRRDSAPQSGAAAQVNVRAYNSIMVFDDAARLTAIYDKVHLVPFGEYLPLEPLLTALGIKKLTHGHGAFSSGAVPKPLLAIAGLPPAAGLICYEALFPGQVVDAAVRPGLIINVTNDGWFGDTTGPRQHFHQTRVRAVEQGVPLIRIANNGISALVDPFGRVLASLGMDVKGVADSDLPAVVRAPPYAQFGDLLFTIMLFFGGLAGFLLHRNGRAN